METINSFYYKVLENFESEDVYFKIGFGEKEYECYITLWSNSFSEISSNFEKYITEGHAEITLDFDTEPTIVHLTREGSMVNVKIIPSHFSQNAEIMSGQIEEKCFLRRLYDGILFGTTFCHDDMGSGLNWYDCKMTCYNMLKSRLVEEYLRTSSIVRCENFVVKHILVYDGNEVLHICDETIGYHLPLSDTMDIRAKNGDVITSVDGTKLKAGEFQDVAASLPDDFDLWVIEKDKDGYISALRVERAAPNDGIVFKKQDEKYKNFGEDPYGFSSETLWHACKKYLDYDLIWHYISLNADMRFFFRWVLSSKANGPSDTVGKSTNKKAAEAMRNRDMTKARIIQSVIEARPEIKLTEDHLKYCVWFYCPQCMKILLENGADPNEQKIDDDSPFFSVKYRSVLNILNLRLEEGKEKHGMLQEMRTLLISHGAKDVVLKNEKYKNH